ncbi:MAG: hypothetical protein CL912_00970 [Deltaproteobacteria bacterium]|nr:hypothetical protein [Deltaproteobacteria bacterium]
MSRHDLHFSRLTLCGALGERFGKPAYADFRQQIVMIWLHIGAYYYGNLFKDSVDVKRLFRNLRRSI